MCSLDYVGGVLSTLVKKDWQFKTDVCYYTSYKHWMYVYKNVYYAVKYI